MENEVPSIVHKVRFLRTQSFFFSCLFLLTSLLHGANKEVIQGIALEAENPLEYDNEKETITASGNALLSGDGIHLSAERIIWDRKTSTVRAEGNIALGVVGYRLLAKSLTLDLQSGAFTAENVKTGLYPWIIEAEQLLASDSNYTIENATFTHENHERFSPGLLIDKAIYETNSTRLQARGIGLTIDGKTIGKFPKLTRKVSGPEPRLELLGGERQPLGWYAGLRMDTINTTSFSSEMEAISYFDRGVFLGPQFSYFKSEDDESYYHNWSATFGGIKDEGDIVRDSRNRQIDQERGYMNIFGISRFQDQWTMALDLNAFSDSEVYRDYDRDGFEQNQWYNNALEVAYEGDDLTISVATKWQANEFQSQAESIPNILVTYGPKSLWNKWTYETLQLEYAERNVRNSLGEKGNAYSKFDFGYKTASTFGITKGLIYTPSISFRWQTFDIDQADSHTRSFWETGNEVSFTLHADYPTESTVWKTEGLRHVMTFSVGHNHVHPLKESTISNSALIEPYLENPNLGPIELLDYLDSDNLAPYEVIRLGWEQELLSLQDGFYERWADLQLYQDAWVDSSSLLIPAPYFYTQARLHPARWLSLDVQAKVNTDTGELFRSAYGLSVLDGFKNEISVHYLAYDQGNDSLQTQFMHILDESKSVSGAIRYDPKLRTFPYWSGLLTIRKPTGWEWSVYLSQRRGTARENDLSWGLGVNLFSF